MIQWISVSIQDPSRIAIINTIYLYDYTIIIILSVVITISYILFKILYSKNYYKFIIEGIILETIWSILPSVILVFLIIPAIVNLYEYENTYTPDISVKIIGHQWFWTTESTINAIEFHSLSVIKTLAVPNPEKKDFLLLPVKRYTKFFVGYYPIFDKKIIKISSNLPNLCSSEEELILPINFNIELLVRSRDVIHSLSLPSAGVKIDAVPGRINKSMITPIRLGKIFGQCAEICGYYHSLIPIVINITTLREWINHWTWILIDTPDYGNKWYKQLIEITIDGKFHKDGLKGIKPDWHYKENLKIIDW